MNRAELFIEIERLKARFEKGVVKQVQLILQAQRIAPNTCFDAGASAADIRYKAVAEAMGTDAISGKCDVYVEALFDHLREQNPLDSVAKSVAHRVSMRQH